MGLLHTFSEGSANCEIVFRFGTILSHLFIFSEEFLEKTTKFSNFQRTVFFFMAHCNFICSAVEFLSLCAENFKTARCREKNSGEREKRQFTSVEILKNV